MFKSFCLIVLAAFVIFNTSAHASVCSQWVPQQAASASQVTEYLNCLVRQSNLTKLSAQWILVKKSLFQLADSNSSSYSYTYAKNLMNPYERNILSMSFSRYNASNFGELLRKLETEIFPEVLRGFTKKSDDNKTSWSFEAMAYQHVAFVEDPMSGTRDGFSETGPNSFYAGTLLESGNRGFAAVEAHAKKHPAALLNILDRSSSWPQLKNLMHRFSACDSNADCLVRQNKAIMQGLMLTLEHPQFVEAVHFQRHAGFGLNNKNYPHAQETLTNNLGCAIRSREGALAAEVAITGYVSYDYSMVQLTQYGKWGFLGRPIYIEGINKQDINSMHRIAGQFQGQNAIIRHISDQAVYSFAQLGGFGGKNPEIKRNIIQVPFNNGQGGSQSFDLKWQLAPGESLQDIIQNRLGGAARIIANYQDPQMAAVVQSNPFFTDTILSFGWNFSRWVEKLKSWNRPVHYYAYGYDYGLRSAPQQMGWKSYYDRVVWVAQNMFPPIQGVP